MNLTTFLIILLVIVVVGLILYFWVMPQIALGTAQTYGPTTAGLHASAYGGNPAGAVMMGAMNAAGGLFSGIASLVGLAGKSGGSGEGAGTTGMDYDPGVDSFDVGQSGAGGSGMTDFLGGEYA